MTDHSQMSHNWHRSIQIDKDPVAVTPDAKPKWSTKALLLLGAGALIGVGGAVMAFAPHHMGAFIDKHADFGAWADRVPAAVQYTMLAVGATSITIYAAGKILYSDRVHKIQWFGVSVPLGERLVQRLEEERKTKEKKFDTEFNLLQEEHNKRKNQASIDFLQKNRHNNDAKNYSNKWLGITDQSTLKTEYDRINKLKTLEFNDQNDFINALINEPYFGNPFFGHTIPKKK